MSSSPPPELSVGDSASDYVSIGVLRSLGQIRGGLVARAIAFNWAVIVASLVGAIWVNHPAVYVAAGLLVGNRQYALLLLVHECAHYLFRRRNTEGRALPWATNDLIGNVFCAWPVGISVQRYRDLHFQHHKHLGTERDPDHEYYCERVTRARLVRLVCNGLLGVRALVTVALYYLPGRASAVPAPTTKAVEGAKAGSARGRGVMVGLVGTQLVIMGAFVASGHWWAYGLLWLLPILTIVPTLNHLRTTAEHAPDLVPAGATPLPITRSNLANLFERELLGPVQFFYHHEHHLYPSVPFYNLAALNRVLIETNYYQRRQGSLKGSYFATLGELSRAADQAAD